MMRRYLDGLSLTAWPVGCVAWWYGGWAETSERGECMENFAGYSESCFPRAAARRVSRTINDKGDSIDKGGS